MPDVKTFPVYNDKGQIGVLTAPARFLDNRSEKMVRLNDGREIRMPADAFEVRPDGSFYLREAGMPPVPETAISKPGAEREPSGAAGQQPEPALVKQLDAAELFLEAYDIQRVPMDCLIDAPVSQRQEGDTLILPVLEEVLVYEKKLLLKEEIRITKRREPVKEIRTITRKDGHS